MSLNELPKYIYDQKTTDFLVHMLLLMPREFEFWGNGGDYEYWNENQNIHIELNSLCRIINELLNSSLSEIKNAYETQFEENLKLCFPIYDLNIEAVHILLNKMKSLLDDEYENPNVGTGKIILDTLRKVDDYIYYQKKMEEYIRKLESENLRLISLRKLGDRNLSKHIGEFLR